MRPRSAALLVAVVAVGALTGSAADAADRRDFVAGAPGLGDPYYPLYGNGGYDVKHYDLDLSYDPATDRLAGSARIKARATQNLYRYNLDLQGLTVRSVKVNGHRASWSRADDHELIVTPRHRLHRGKKFTTVVRYDGVPRTQVIPGFGIEAGFIHTDDGAIIAGQPEVAANWFPVNDHPLDKASYTIEMTVPAGLEVIGNGRLVDHRTRKGLTTWTWDAREPMASYLATASVGQYELDTYRIGRLKFYDAIDPDLYTESTDPEDPAAPTFGEIIDQSFARQGEILGFLSDTFGRYPFSTAGGSVDDYDQLFFALENQTRSVYSKYFFFDTIGGDAVIVHENAHQWFGDSVAVARWKDIWLNEGFATYAEWLWSEHEGLGTTQEIFDFFYNDIFPPGDPFWEIVVADPGVEHLFDNPSYYRGAMTMHELRRAVGDDDFFRIGRTWASRKAGGNATTEEFIAHAEKVSGEQLDDLFQAWVFSPTRPAVEGAAAAERRAAARTGQPPAVAVRELARYGHRR